MTEPLDIAPVDVKQIVFGDDFVDEAVQVFEDEYRRVLPTGTREADEHHDAVRSAIEAVLVWSLDLEPQREAS